MFYLKTFTILFVALIKTFFSLRTCRISYSIHVGGRLKQATFLFFLSFEILSTSSWLFEIDRYLQLSSTCVASVSKILR